MHATSNPSPPTFTTSCGIHNAVSSTERQCSQSSVANGACGRKRSSSNFMTETAIGGGHIRRGSADHSHHPTPHTKPKAPLPPTPHRPPLQHTRTRARAAFYRVQTKPMWRRVASRRRRVRCSHSLLLLLFTSAPSSHLPATIAANRRHRREYHTREMKAQTNEQKKTASLPTMPPTFSTTRAEGATTTRYCHYHYHSPLRRCGMTSLTSRMQSQ